MELVSTWLSLVRKLLPKLVALLLVNVVEVSKFSLPIAFNALGMKFILLKVSLLN